MTERELFVAIGELDEQMIAWAERPPMRRITWKWAAAAAAVIVLAGGVWTYGRLWGAGADDLSIATPTNPATPTTEGVTRPTEPLPPVSDDLPLLLGGGITSTGGGGGDGYVFAYDIKDIILSTVWEQTPETMTVWRVSDDYNGDYERQMSIIRRYAALLGDTIDEETVSTIQGTDSPYAIDSGRFTQAITERYRYELNSDYTYLAIRLQQPVAVGEQTEWLKQAQVVCPALFADMTAPAIHRIGGDRGWGSTDGETMFATDPFYSARIYDAADPDGAYAPFLKGVGLHIYEGELKGFYVYLPEYYETVGSYPVLSREEAGVLLESRCATYLAQQVPNAAIDETYRIVGAELVYYSDSISRLRVPVYRFLLTAADTEYIAKVKGDTGMDAFVEAFVSAVPSEYWHPDAEGVWSPI